MANQSHRPVLLLVAALLGGCAGSGAGLDQNGNPIGTGSSAPSSAPAGVAADFQSIQDSIFTPICTRCHIGASAPEGLQLDAAHSYAMLVGVPSAEVASELRVKAGDPTDSYLIQKLEGSSGIVGAQMPFGGPYLPQSSIDMIKQWITSGAPQAAATSSGPQVSAGLAVTATMPVAGSAVEKSLATIAVGFSHVPDVAYLHGAVHLQAMGAAPADVPVMIEAAQGNPATVLLTPLAPLPPGAYRLTLHGGDARAITSVDGASLSADYSFTFTVESP
jgi:hypothetical protein